MKEREREIEKRRLKERKRKTEKDKDGKKKIISKTKKCVNNTSLTLNCIYGML